VAGGWREEEAAGEEEPGFSGEEEGTCLNGRGEERAGGRGGGQGPGGPHGPSQWAPACTSAHDAHDGVVLILTMFFINLGHDKSPPLRKSRPEIW
jgi:hypothetical protein